MGRVEVGLRDGWRGGGVVSNGRRGRVGSSAVAFTLIETLLVVAVVAILSGVGIAVVSNVAEGNRVSKLESDVAVINSAVQVFRVSGGTLPNSTNVNVVLTELKRAATAASGSRVAGFRGGTVDPRLLAVLQDAGEAASTQRRARWDATALQLVIVDSGEVGVKRFELNDAAGEVALAAATRATNNPKAVADPWVWDYTDTAPLADTGPSTPLPGSAAGVTTPGAEQPQVLSAPTLSPVGGTYAIFDFPMTVTLTNLNPAGASRLRKRPDVSYDGQPIVVVPGDSISGYYAQSIDPTRWLDSPDVAGTYSAVPFQLEVTLTMPPASVTYLEAGGAMTNANSAPPLVATLATNTGEVPEAYRGSAYYEVRWTTDGSDPLTSNTAAMAPGSWDGVSALTIPLPLAGFTSTGLQFQAVVVAVNTTYFASSPVRSGTVGIEKMTLWPPLIDPGTTARSADLPVHLYEGINKSYPSGIRFYYLTNGAEPGVADGEPTSGTLYTGSFQTGSTDGSGIVKARIYPPSNLTQWFNASAVSTAVYTNGSGGTGAVVADASINGTYIGSLIITATKNFNLNSGASIKAGNLFVRGTPEVNTSNGGVIEGRQFLSDGTEVIPATDTRKVVDLNGDPNPSNYTIRLNSGSKIEGKVYRRVNIFVPPPVAAPPAPSNNNNANINSQPSAPLNATAAANVNLNNGAGEVVLNPGNWGNMNSGSGTSFIIGTVGATTPTVYNFQSLNLNSNSQLKVVGPVILTIDRGLNLSSSVLGNVDRPEWLNLRIHSGNFSINSGAAGYADLNAPDSSVNLNGIFTGSVVAKTLSINGNGVAITQATITEGGN